MEVEELCHTLGVDFGSTILDCQNIPMIEALIGSPWGLMMVEVATYTARLIHCSLKDHLSDNIGMFHRPHSAIAEASLTFPTSSASGTFPLLLICPRK